MPAGGTAATSAGPSSSTSGPQSAFVAGPGGAPPIEPPYGWGQYFTDIPRGIWKAMQGDQSCRTAGCQMGRELISAVGFGVGDSIETLDAMATFQAWRRGEAYFGDVVNQSIVAAAPGVFGVMYRHYVNAVQTGTQAVVDTGRRLFVRDVPQAARPAVARTEPLVSAAMREGDLTGVSQLVTRRQRLDNGLLVEPAADGVSGVRILPDGRTSLGDAARRADDLGADVYFDPSRVDTHTSGAFVRGGPGERHRLYVDRDEFAGATSSPHVSHELDHARGAATGAQRGQIAPLAGNATIRPRAPVDTTEAADYLRDGFTFDEVYTHARDVRRNTSLYHANPTPERYQDIVAFTQRGRALSTVTAEGASDALRHIDENPGALDFGTHNGRHYGGVEVNGSQVVVDLGVTEMPPPAQARALARQRLEELRDAASESAAGFERHARELDRLNPGGRWSPGQPPPAVPGASDLHLSARDLGPANPLRPPAGDPATLPPDSLPAANRVEYQRH
jgi:hypothetical protein